VSAHLTPRDDHPLIDADGHWIVDYGPVVHEQLPKTGVDAVVLAMSAPVRAAAE
jgi:hypothetical protein